MEREPTIKERIELFIQRLLDNGFVEQDEDEVQIVYNVSLQVLLWILEYLEKI